VARIRLYRDALASALAQRPGIEVVGTAATAKIALDQVKALQPDIIILEGTGALDHDTVKELASRSALIRVVALGIAPDEEAVLEGIQAGAAGYVSRDDTFEDLVETIYAVSRNELHCSPGMTGAMLRRLATVSATSRSVAFEAPLTAREHEILALLGQALSNKQIAAKLGIEVATVKNHVHHLLEKLHVRRRAEAVLLGHGPD
jgi:DNA-binding NarL/FixJ family response regulator